MLLQNGVNVYALAFVLEEDSNTLKML